MGGDFQFTGAHRQGGRLAPALCCLRRRGAFGGHLVGPLGGAAPTVFFGAKCRGPHKTWDPGARYSPQGKGAGGGLSCPFELRWGARGAKGVFPWDLAKGMPAPPAQWSSRVPQGHTGGGGLPWLVSPVPGGTRNEENCPGGGPGAGPRAPPPMWNSPAGKSKTKSPIRKQKPPENQKASSKRGAKSPVSFGTGEKTPPRKNR